MRITPKQAATADSSKWFLLIMRTPYFEKVEGLSYLVRYLSEVGYGVGFLSGIDEDYLAPRSLPLNAHHAGVDGSVRFLGRKFPCPTSLKLFLRGSRLATASRPRFVLGADTIGSIVGGLVARVVGVPFVCYNLELPQPARGKQRRARVIGRMEHLAIRASDLLITFDDAHAEFISRETGLPRSRIANMPNSGPGPARAVRSTWLADELDISDKDIIILHSGGLGPWFDSLAFARAARTWPDRWHLVFHTSHRLRSSAYLDAFMREVDGRKVILHDRPVPADHLDSLISSAHIGLATYSVPLLGHRAKLMGLASGKIGRCLKNGVPVIATDVPTIRSYLEKYSCGLTVAEPEHTREAIGRVVDNYAEYSDNALQCFREVWDPDRSCADIAQRLSSIGRRVQPAPERQ